MHTASAAPAAPAPRRTSMDEFICLNTTQTPHAAAPATIAARFFGQKVGA